MSRKRKGKPTWQNLWHKKPEDVSDEDFDKWENYQKKISDGMQRTIDRLEKERKKLKDEHTTRIRRT